jgi:hypothetical protein
MLSDHAFSDGPYGLRGRDFVCPTLPRLWKVDDSGRQGSGTSVAGLPADLRKCIGTRSLMRLSRSTTTRCLRRRFAPTLPSHDTARLRGYPDRSNQLVFGTGCGSAIGRGRDCGSTCSAQARDSRASSTRPWRSSQRGDSGTQARTRRASKAGQHTDRAEAAPVDRSSRIGAEHSADAEAKRDDAGDEAADPAALRRGHEPSNQREVDAAQSADAQADEEPRSIDGWTSRRPA